MSTTLPELPEFDGWIGANDIDPDAGVEGFTAETVHAYGLAVWKAAMEVAAKECERYEGEQWQKYKRGHGPERASDYCQGQSDGGGDCANAIRSLPLPEQGSPQ